MNQPDKRATVLTLNLWGANPPYMNRMAQLREFIIDNRPDILAFQEVVSCDGSLQTELVIDGLAYECYYSDTTGTQSGTDGLAICTYGHEVLSSQCIPLPTPSNERPRYAQVLSVVIRGLACTIVNTHLTYGVQNDSLRLEQVSTILSSVDRVANPIVICGDLNEVPTGRAVSAMTEGSRLVDTWIAGAEPGDNGVTFDPDNHFLDPEILDPRRYDYVFASPSVGVADSRVVMSSRDGLGPVSDHYGLHVSLSIPSLNVVGNDNVSC